MTDEEAVAVELMFPRDVWGLVYVKPVDEPGSPYTHEFYFPEDEQEVDNGRD
jgi:hypothetical protein